MVRQQDLMVTTLGQCRYRSPLGMDAPAPNIAGFFASDAVRIRVHIEVGPGPDAADGLSFEEAGPREQIFFEPAATTAAIVTCGGLSPGLNNVIRSIYYELTENYGVPRMLGIRNGYQGLNPQVSDPPIELTREMVGEIHKLGGTAIGTSRGPQEPSVIADFLHAQGINILFCVGGDGTQRGAHAIHAEVQRRGLPIAIVGIPKTIDNDIPYVRRTFGYATALEKAAEAIRGAHVEARSAAFGIGLVKLMGRDAGFIAAGASLVSQEVNFTLIPEVSFPLEGDGGFLDALEKRLRKRQHAVVVVAEGAGQHLFDQAQVACDASGNPLHHDIGPLLKARIVDYFKTRNFPVSLKYIDPSYLIRSVPADGTDRYLCDQMARHAVHAGMSGKTGMLVGLEHDQFIHVPIPVAVAEKKQVDLRGDLWRSVLQVTRQPLWEQARDA